jgi:transposase
MAKHTTICAGIDTGKRKLDVALEGSGEPLQVENTSEGHTVLLAWLRRHRVKRVGIKASGGYEQPVVAELRRKRFVVVVFQPAQVRAYAKFHAQRAKNDKIDAALIAASIRHSLRPLYGRTVSAKTRTHRAAGMRSRICSLLRGATRRSNPFFLGAARWIASRSLSSGAHSRDPLARDGGFRIGCLKFWTNTPAQDR